MFKITKKSNLWTVHPRPVFIPIGFFWNTVPLNSLGIVESKNFVLRILHGFSACRDKIKLIWRIRQICLGCLEIRKYDRIRGENLCVYVHGEDPKTRDTKLRISRLIMVRHEVFFGPYFLNKMGWIKPKTISRYCHFKRHRIVRCKCRANTIKFQWKRKTLKHFNIFKHIFTGMYILFSALTIMYVYPRITRRLSAAYYFMHNYMLIVAAYKNFLSIFFSQKVLRIKTEPDTRWITIASIAGGRLQM